MLKCTILIAILSCVLQFTNGQLSSVQVERIEINPIEPKPGESVKIRCYLKNVDPSKRMKPDILWSFRKSGDYSWRIVGNGGSVTETFNNRLSGRKESDEVFEIVFRPIQETDIGTIKCELTNSEGQLFKMQDINVFSPPYINFITPDVYSKVGRAVTLECRAEGNPKPVVKWSRLGELSAVLFSSTFELTSLGREDRGTYKCYAESVTPVRKLRQYAEAFVTVTIDFPPTINCGASAIYQVAGIKADAEITCMIDGYPLNTVRWFFMQIDFNIETEIVTDQNYKIENVVSADSIKSVLIIRNVVGGNFGGYTIKVEGGMQQTEEKTVMLEPMTPERLASSAWNY